MDEVVQPEPSRRRSARQLKLFHLTDPLTERFGSAFFQSLPERPGVYSFFDATDQLLYIGQSANLRHRISSYRHVSEQRHPRRTLRLVARIQRITWRECATAGAAIEEESRLLLAHRPPFNRAGVWKGDPWWLAIRMQGNGLELALTMEPIPGAMGPLPPGFRHVLPALIRCALRLQQPARPMAHFPCGLMRRSAPKVFNVSSAQAAQLHERLVQALRGELDDWIEALQQMPGGSETEREFWSGECETLQRFQEATKRKGREALDSKLPPQMVTPQGFEP